MEFQKIAERAKNHIKIGEKIRENRKETEYKKAQKIRFANDKGRSFFLKKNRLNGTNFTTSFNKFKKIDICNDYRIKRRNSGVYMRYGTKKYWMG